MRSVLPRLLLVVPALLLLGGPARVEACPFCSASGQTMTQELNLSSVILYGKLKNPMRGADDLYGDGTTELEIAEVVKPHDIVKGRTKVTLSRYIPVLDKNANDNYLIFCDVYKGKIDPFRGEPVGKDETLLKYVKGLIKHKDDKPGERLKFFFEFLDGTDPVIRGDAYREFAYADYKDLVDVYKQLPADKIAAWLADPRMKTEPGRLGLYGSMLGHASKDPEKHGKQLRAIIEDAETYGGIGIDGVIAGYLVLQPKEAYELILDITKDSKRPFKQRYPVLKALRFFVDQKRLDVVSQKQVTAAILPLFEDKDMADLCIEDLRRWKWWGPTAEVLAVYDKHEKPIVRRAVIRYALSNPSEECKKFIAAERKRNNELVDEIVEWMKYEDSPTTGTGTGSTKTPTPKK